MPIDIVCPSCGKRLKAPDTAAGKRVKCPQCSAAVPVPAAPAAARPISAPPPMSGVADLIDEALQEQALKQRQAEEQEFYRQQDEALRATREGAKQQAQSKAAKPLANPDEDLTVFDWMMIVFCCWAALIMSIVYMVQGKKKGVKLLIAIVVVNVIAFFIGVVIGVVQVLMNQ
jgi:hypothetical protein